MNKRALAVALTAQMILQPAAFANTIKKPEVKSDNSVVVTGNLTTRGEMLVNMYIREGSKGESLNENLRVINSTKSNADGSYTFTIDLENAVKNGGAFVVKTTAQKENTDEYSFEFYTTAEVASVVERIKDVADDKAKVAQIISEEKDKLAYREPTVIKPSVEKYASDIAGIITESAVTADNIHTKMLKASIIKQIEASTDANSINDMLETYEDVLEINNINAYKNLSDDAKALMGKNIVAQNAVYSSTQDFNKDITACTALGRLQTANGTSALYNILTDSEYSSVFNLTNLKSNKTVILNKLATALENNSVHTIAAVQTILNTTVTTTPSNNNNTTSGRGQTGSSGSISIPTFTPKPSATETPSAAEKGFGDLENYKWAQASILRLNGLDILNGYSDTEFAPQDDVSRAQLCKIICGVFGFTASDTSTPFNDVSEDAWYTPYVSELYRRGIINGVDENAFAPNDGVTRQDMCAMLYRAGISGTSYTDEIPFNDVDEIADYAKEAVKFLSEQKLINGTDDGNFDPKRFAARAEVAVLFNSVYDYLTANPVSDTPQVTADSAYERASAVLSGLDIIANNESNPQKKVTRGDFAGYLLDYMGVEYPESEEAEEVSSAVAADEWAWNGDFVEKQSTPTEFSDVTTDHRNWNKIKTAVTYGVMSGYDDGSFHPDDYMTNGEMYTILVNSLGMGIFSNGEYPNGYMGVAVSEGISKNIKNMVADEGVTYRDMVIAMYNALFTQVYEVSLNGETTRSDSIFLNYAHKIYEGEGIVKSNGISTLDTNESVSGGYYKIGDEVYGCEKNYTSYLGYRVMFYYKETKLENKIVFMYPDAKNKQLVVDAEDIIDYEKPNLIYYNGDKKEKEYLGAETYIVYNGKALLDYSTDDLKIKEGSIKFIDNDNDGKYEVAVIDSIETVYVNAVDNIEQIVYATGTDAVAVSFKDADYAVYDKQGILRDFEAINKDFVLTLRRTLSTQGRPYINIIISSDKVTGKITGINLRDEIITVNGTEYKLSDMCDGNEFKINTEYTFSLTADGKIAYAKIGSALEYGYLIDIYTDKSGEEYYAKMFAIDENEVKDYTFGERVTLNGKGTKTASAASSSVLSQNGATTAQLIRYASDDNGNITQILTVGTDDELFVESTADYSGKSLTYRSNIKCFVDESGTGLPVVYSDSATKLINIPKSNKYNYDAYFTKTLYVDNKYTLDEVYTSGKDNAVASILIVKSNETSGKQIIGSSTVNIVKSVSKTVVDEQEAVCVEVMNGKGSKEYYVTDNDLIAAAENLNLGDMIRFTTLTKDKTIMSNFEKIFDGESRMIVSGKNPWNNYSHNSIIAPAYILHGTVDSRSAEGYLRIAPYKYTTEDNVVSKNGVSEVQSEWLTIPLNSITVYVIDSRGIYIAGADESIMDAESAGEGSEVVIYTSWENPQSIVLYK